MENSRSVARAGTGFIATPGKGCRIRSRRDERGTTSLYYTDIGGLYEDEDEGVAYEEGSPAAAAKAALSARVSLARGLAATASQGRPISAKFEIDEGKLELSVYTMKGGKFFEVNVDPTSGAVVKTEPIGDGEDYTAAQSQSAAMATAKASLRAAVPL